jgi:hypothetical protein
MNADLQTFLGALVLGVVLWGITHPKVYTWLLGYPPEAPKPRRRAAYRDDYRDYRNYR